MSRAPRRRASRRTGWSSGGAGSARTPRPAASCGAPGAAGEHARRGRRAGLVRVVLALHREALGGALARRGGLESAARQHADPARAIWDTGGSAHAPVCRREGPRVALLQAAPARLCLKRRSGGLKVPTAFTVLPRSVLRRKIVRLLTATVGRAGAGRTSEDPRRPAAGGGPRGVLGLSL